MTTGIVVLLAVVSVTSQLVIMRRAATAAFTAGGTVPHDPTRWQAAVSRGGTVPEAPLPASGTSATFVSWKTLRSLDIASGIALPPLDRLHGQPVRLVGFIIPVDDLAFETAEFLFVPYAGACVHAPVPPVNQMVLVRMRNGQPIPVAWGEPVELDGVLHIEPTESVYATSAFRLDGTGARLARTDGS